MHSPRVIEERNMLASYLARMFDVVLMLKLLGTRLLGLFDRSTKLLNHFCQCFHFIFWRQLVVAQMEADDARFEVCSPTSA